MSRYVLQGIEPKVRIRRSFAVLNSWKENFFNVSRRLANLSRRAIVFPFNFLIGLNRIFRKKELMIDCPIKERYLKEKEEEILGYFFFCNFSLSCCLFLDNSKTLSFFFFSFISWFDQSRTHFRFIVSIRKVTDGQATVR